jgi:uncharacterized protein YecA (UPF0149 family)
MEFKVNGYTLTDEPHILNKGIEINDEIEDELKKASQIAIAGKKSDLEQLKYYSQKFPEILEFKNYLALLYSRIGKYEKAIQLNEYMTNNFPNCLYGRLNMAHEFYKAMEFHKMKEVLGESMELKDLLPERKIFYVGEFANYMRMTTLYFAGINEMDKAENRLQILKDLDPYLPYDDSIEAEINIINLFRDIDDFEDEEVLFSESKENQAEETGVESLFNHPELIDLNLFEHLSEEFLTEILDFPKETLIQDLEAIISNTLQEYHHGIDFIEEAPAALHAVLILTEIESYESLPKIMELLKQDFFFIDNIFYDLITEYMWSSFYKLGQNQTELLKQFMCDANIYPYAKTEIAKAVEQIAQHQPERREEVVNWFKEVFEFYISCPPDDDNIDTEMIGLIIGSALDLQLKELLPQIKELYDLNYAHSGICGNYEEVEADILSKTNKARKEKIFNIRDVYNSLRELDEDYFSDEIYEEFEDDIEDDLDFPDTNKPIIKEKKVGRNEPCPCGSGKKYKKCCLNK